MADSVRYVRAGLGALALLAALQAPPQAIAETAEERLQRLEQEIRELREQMKSQQPVPADSIPATTPAGSGAAGGVTATPAPQAAPAPQAVPAPQAAPAPPPAPARQATPASAPTAPAAAPAASGAYVRYYISDDSLGDRPPTDMAPNVQGRFPETASVSFDPATYDLPGSGLLSHYRDPSSYRYVGVLLDSEMPIDAAGDYEFVVSPKPVRDGGTTVSTRMTVALKVDDRPVVTFSDQSSWQTRRGSIRLEPGDHRLTVWAMSSSDGFGPSPTDSHLTVQVKGPGDVSPRPLRGLRPVTD